MPDGLPELVDGAHGHGAQMRLEFGEGHFDGIEVGAVGRQKQEPGALFADGLFGAELLWAGRLSKMTMSPFCRVGTSWVRVGLEDRPVHRRVDYQRRSQGAAAQPGDESLGFPMAEGGLERRRSPFSKRPRARVIFVVVPVSSMKTSLMGLGPHLGLAFSLPRLARLAHVGPIAFGSPEGFFLKLRPLRISQRDSEAGRLSRRSRPEFAGQLRHADVVLLRNAA